MSLDRVLRAIDRAAERWELDAETRATGAKPQARVRGVTGRLTEHVDGIKARLRDGEPVKSIAAAFETQPRDIRAIRDGRCRHCRKHCGFTCRAARRKAA